MRESELITVMGERVPSGAYLLRLQIKRQLMVRFGRFQGGQPILVPEGEAAYVGSAMALRGSATLAQRLVRHATRADASRPQPIRPAMVKVFKEMGLGPAGLKPPAKKRLFWNIDYLLEQDDVDLSHVMVMRSLAHCEDRVASILADMPESKILAKGLGAHDRPGQSHLYLFGERGTWWQELLGNLINVMCDG